jgi:predicted neuraminidase
MKINFRVLTTILLLGFFINNQADAQKVEVLQEEFIYDEAPFPSCHASTIASIPGGVIVAWFGGTHENNPDVEIWSSRKMFDGEWTKPVSLANGIQHQDKRYPTWNPVLFKYPNGPLVLFYKVGKNPREWWGEMRVSFDNGITWSEKRRLPEDILGPVKNKPILLESDMLLCPSSKEDEVTGWQVYMEMTPDMGKTWKLIGPIGDVKEFDIIQPSILSYEDGRMQILCRSKNDYVVESWSSDNGFTWTNPKASTLPNPGSGTDALTAASNLQVVIYNHNNSVVNHFSQTQRSPLNLGVSEDGEKWKMIHTFEDEKGEFSYPAIIQDSKGIFHATYTYNRKKIKYVKFRLVD